MYWLALSLIAMQAAPALEPMRVSTRPLMRSEPSLGTENAGCRPGETGPAVRIEVRGLKDRRGILRTELYPDNDQDFMEDDNILLSAGKTFKRVDMPIPAKGPVSICIRAPRAGRYTLALLHDRNGDHKFNPFTDGAGFPGNPRIRRSKPKAALATVSVGSGVRDIAIRMNYLRGFVFRPLPQG